MIPEGVVLVAGPYSATGVTNTYDFEFPCSSDENVEVTMSVDGVESVLVLDTDFTVSLNPDQDSTPGGTVTITPIPASGTLVVIASNVPAQQGLDLTQGGSFNPETIEQKFDDIVLMIGRLRADIDRAVKSGITSSTDPDVLIAALLAAEASAAASAAAAELAAAAAEAAVPSGSLGYTPVNKAGDTMLGGLTVPSLTVGSQTITGITALGKTLVQIASQAAARSAVDAAQKTSSQTTAAPATGDYVSFSDVSDSGNEKKATLADLLALATPAATTDVLVKIDFAAGSASGTFTKPTGASKCLVEVVGGGGLPGGGAGGGGGYSAKVFSAADVSYVAGGAGTSSSATVSGTTITGGGSSSQSGGAGSGGDVNSTGGTGTTSGTYANSGGAARLLGYGKGCDGYYDGSNMQSFVNATPGCVRVTWFK